MRVLISCEYSGAVRDAFIAEGHDAMSCDLLPTDVPGPHYQGSVLDILDGWVPVSFSAECDPDGDGWCYKNDCNPSECKCIGPTQDDIEYIENENGLFGRPINKPGWDLLIAHPPCTHLCVSGLHWNNRGRGWKGTEDALEFFRLLLNADIPRIAIENPIGIASTRIRPADQTIQPWQFGHPESKATQLWLKGLPLLKPTNILKKPESGRWENQTASGQNKLPPSADRWKIRSATYQGIAQAMAKQWGAVELDQEPGESQLKTQQNLFQSA